ncbi:unnamed protein product [Caenorhabditis sp. 36 PRJEB53466]|nr:unnamed protein product [Caenorhabditis sp. 36 PRJEB53466]
MNGQADRCDRTAYVSGLQPTISDIELFEVFNRVAHVEKVIVRNGAVRHALVVFKSVQGLYKVLVEFQGSYLHGRQLHIRPLRESSHANTEKLANMWERYTTHGHPHHRRPASVQERLSPASFVQPTDTNINTHRNCRGYRNSSGSSERRCSEYNRNVFPNETYAGLEKFDNHPVPQYASLRTDNFHFDDYTEGARRFDGLAVLRANTPPPPFANCQEGPKECDSQKGEPRCRSGSSREMAKTAPPTWKMELQIKRNEVEGNWKPNEPAVPPPPLRSDVSMTPQQFFAEIAQAELQHEQALRKKRPNLSVINPSLFYEQYPRTSSPVHFMPSMQSHGDRIPSPHDPAVLAYSHMRVPQSAFAGLSPIDTNNCSFITKHLGTSNENASNLSQIRRDMTNEELSDMIVSTGNLRINPVVGQQCSLYDNSVNDEPAPWSPVKRLRAESGSLSTAQFVSPQFSPIRSKPTEFSETEDEVFSSENKQPTGQLTSVETKQYPLNNNGSKILMEQKIQNYEDINNSRLPSNSHSANANTDKKEFVFPDYPMCRHSSVPSIAHIVGDLSDFGLLSPHVTAGAKLHMDHSSLLSEFRPSDTKSWGSNNSGNQLPNEAKQASHHQMSLEHLIGI